MSLLLPPAWRDGDALPRVISRAAAEPKRCSTPRRRVSAHTRAKRMQRNRPCRRTLTRHSWTHRLADPARRALTAQYLAAQPYQQQRNEEERETEQHHHEWHEHRSGHV